MQRLYQFEIIIIQMALFGLGIGTVMLQWHTHAKINNNVISLQSRQQKNAETPSPPSPEYERTLLPQPQHQRINRHSSQLAIRKASVHSSTPRDSEADLRNIRQTTFWMKRTVGVSGVENLHPNAHARRVCESRSRQVFSMKVHTENSETDSCVKKIEEVDHTDLDSKMILIEKSQKQIGNQISMVANQNLPKLPTCQNLFNSLNKSLKLATINMQKVIGPHLQNILTHHIELTTQLFQKVLAHSQNFIFAQKSTHLITKTIEQQKQISKLVNQCAEYEREFQKFNTKGHQNSEHKFINLRDINLERIMVAGYRIGQSKQLTGYKVNQLCRQISQNVISLRNGSQIGYFQAMSQVLRRLISHKQSSSILKSLLKQKSLGNCPSINKNFVHDILKSNLNLQFLAIVRKKLLRFLNYQQNLKLNDKNSVDIRTVLNFVGKFSILKDKTRQKQQIMDIITMVEVSGQERIPNQSQIKDIGARIQEDYIQIYEMKGNGNGSQKLLKLNNKRLVNCANLYQKKTKKKKCDSGADPKNADTESQTNLHPIPNQNSTKSTARLNINFYTEDLIILAYYYIAKQLQYISDAALALNRFSAGTYGCFQTIAQKLLEKQYADVVKNSEVKQKQEILVLAMSLGKIYGQEGSMRKEAQQQALKEWLKLAKADILRALAQEKRLVLSQLTNN